jgi:glycosyltransferase involved in cell wall biosynthesis
MEIVIVDDASTDSTLAIIREFMRRDTRIVLYQNAKRLGLVGNWNRCLELARGDWIKFLFQDDVLAPECIEAMLRAGAESDVELVVCDRQFRFEGDIDDGFRARFSDYVAAHHFDRSFPAPAVSIAAVDIANKAAIAPTGNFVGEPTAVMFRKRVTAAYGVFNPDLQQIPDWEYWLRIGVHTGLRRIPRQLVTFRLHGGGTTHANVGSAVRRDLLDDLVLLHDFVLRAHFAPVREAAARHRPPVDLRAYLDEEYLRVRRAMANARRDAVAIPAAVQSLWRQLRTRYPAISPGLRTYFETRLRTVLRTRRHAVGKWVRKRSLRGGGA